VTDRDPLATHLVDIVGRDHVIEDPALLASYETDWTRRFHGHARLVVRPGTPAEAGAVLAVCSSERVAVVPQGGNTGLVGGAVPPEGAVVLSMRRLVELGAVDRAAGQLTAGAGVTLGELQRHARAADLDIGLDLAARDSATLGGLIATNAGGIRAMRYGSMRSQVVGIEAYLVDGTRVGSLAGLTKDNTGYHWPSLLAGSEGTLAVVTRARLLLVRIPRRRACVLLGLPDLAAAVALASELRERVPSLEALEVFDSLAMALLARHRGMTSPLKGSSGVYLLAEAAADQDPTNELVEAIAAAPGALDAAIGTDGPDRARLWAFRESITEVIEAEGVPHKLDVSLPMHQLTRFDTDVRATAIRLTPSCRAVVYGHLGDGNLHVNLLGLEPDDERVDEAVLRLVAELGGSISAEHGIGRAKAAWLSLARRTGEIDAMRALKRSLDPDFLLNPGVLFS